MQSSGTELLSYVTECDSWKFIGKFSVGGALRGCDVRGFVRELRGDIQPHYNSVYGSRGVTSFRSKFGLCCKFIECRIISYRYLGP